MNLCLIGGGRKRAILKSALDATYSPDTPTNVLLVPSACSTPTSYNRKVGPHRELFTSMGVSVDILHDYGQAPVDPAKKFGKATLIFTIAGNSPYMLETLKTHGTDRQIVQAARDGKMLAGTSSGGLLPFAVGHSNPSAKRGEDFDFTFLDMLGVIGAAAAMHADQVDPPKDFARLDDFVARFDKTGQKYGLGVENHAGLIVIEGLASIGRSVEGASIHLVERAPVGEPASCRRIEDNADMAEVFATIQAA